MSLDSSLKINSAMVKHRNVLSRAERIERLRQKNKFDPSAGNPLGLQKVGNRKLITAKAAKKKGAAEGDAAAPASK
jgi:small basic protein (TIGR04137 family)